MNRIVLISLSLALAACSSLVSDPCAGGYELVGGHCVTMDRPDATIGGGDSGDAGATDGGPRDGTTTDGTPTDAPVCAADTTSDPDNCGACGHVCASGICVTSKCVGELPGHIVVIGHDYSTHHAAMARVLGNAVALGAHHDVAVMVWQGTASASSNGRVMASLSEGMSAVGRAWHTVALPTAPGTQFAAADVLVVEPQTGSGDEVAGTAAAWAVDVTKFLQRNGVVVVLEGAGTVSYRFADATGLYTMAAPSDATGQTASMLDSSDAVANRVVAPYLAETSSAAFPPEFGPGVFATSAGPLVLHFTRF